MNELWVPPESRLLASLKSFVQRNVDLTIELVRIGDDPIIALDRLKALNEATFAIAGVPSSPLSSGVDSE